MYDEKGRPVDSWGPLDEQLQGETYAHALAVGSYYLEFAVLDVRYTVTVEAWIPE